MESSLCRCSLVSKIALRQLARRSKAPGKLLGLLKLKMAEKTETFLSKTGGSLIPPECTEQKAVSLGQSQVVSCLITIRWNLQCKM